jgi:hypothetical protein
MLAQSPGVSSMEFMNSALTKLHEKMDKLAALADHPATSREESDAALERWQALAVKARRMELGK